MIAVDESTKEFVRLIGVAINIAGKMRADVVRSGVNLWMLESIDKTINILNGYCDTALSGRLPRISRGDVPAGAGISLSRGVGEWTEDDAFLEAIYSIEDYYKKYM